MRTAVGSRHTRTVGPAVTVHQPSIRVRDAAHDVVFDRRRSSDRRRWASQSVGRSGATINHPENARTGTIAVRPPGPSRRWRSRLRRNVRRLDAQPSGTAPAAELVVIDLVAQHDVQPDLLQRLGHTLLVGPVLVVDANTVSPGLARRRRGAPARSGEATCEEPSR
jgi:hypothetical protein